MKRLHAVAAALLFGAMAFRALAAPAADPPITPMGLPQADRAKILATMPNWSGTWMPIGRGYFDESTVDPPTATTINPGDREHPPYNKEWEAKYRAIIDKSKAGFFFDPITNCTPHGMPRLMGGSIGAVEFVVTPEQTWIIFEWGSQLRRIYTDGRPHPPADELWPLWTGDSIGHWEGDTLVVDTISMRDDTPFDRTGAPHSDQVHVTERIRMIDHDHLNDEVITEDPVSFTKPWHTVRRFSRAPQNQRIIDVICTENVKNDIVNGQTQLHLPSDPPGYVMGALPLDGSGKTAPQAPAK